MQRYNKYFKLARKIRKNKRASVITTSALFVLLKIHRE
nr:MAG TPA_asm: hypothetical protein [Caudoviricetes sp.]